MPISDNQLHRGRIHEHIRRRLPDMRRHAFNFLCIIFIYLSLTELRLESKSWLADPITDGLGPLYHQIPILLLGQLVLLAVQCVKREVPVPSLTRAGLTGGSSYSSADHSYTAALRMLPTRHPSPKSPFQTVAGTDILYYPPLCSRMNSRRVWLAWMRYVCVFPD